MELLIEREAELKNLENSQPTPIAKNKKASLEDNMKSVIKGLFDKKINADMK